MFLVPATLESLAAELRAPSALAEVIRMEVADGWPPELYDRDPIEFTIRRYQVFPDEANWWLYYFVLKAEADRGAVAIGCGGYKGPPTADGTVEIGYSIVPEYRRLGLATEAAQGLIAYAFALDDVQRVIAETLPELQASIGVLTRCGFAFAGTGSAEGTIRYVKERS